MPEMKYFCWVAVAVLCTSSLNAAPQTYHQVRHHKKHEEKTEEIYTSPSASHASFVQPSQTYSQLGQQYNAHQGQEQAYGQSWNQPDIFNQQIDHYQQPPSGIAYGSYHSSSYNPSIPKMFQEQTKGHIYRSIDRAEDFEDHQTKYNKGLVELISNKGQTSGDSVSGRSISGSSFTESSSPKLMKLTYSSQSLKPVVSSDHTESISSQNGHKFGELTSSVFNSHQNTKGQPATFSMHQNQEIYGRQQKESDSDQIRYAVPLQQSPVQQYGGGSSSSWSMSSSYSSGQTLPFTTIKQTNSVPAENRNFNTMRVGTDQDNRSTFKNEQNVFEQRGTIKEIRSNLEQQHQFGKPVVHEQPPINNGNLGNPTSWSIVGVNSPTPSYVDKPSNPEQQPTSNTGSLWTSRSYTEKSSGAHPQTSDAGSTWTSHGSYTVQLQPLATKKQMESASLKRYDSFVSSEKGPEFVTNPFTERIPVSLQRESHEHSVHVSQTNDDARHLNMMPFGATSRPDNNNRPYVKATYVVQTIKGIDGVKNTGAVQAESQDELATNTRVQHHQIVSQQGEDENVQIPKMAFENTNGNFGTYKEQHSFSTHNTHETIPEYMSLKPAVQTVTEPFFDRPQTNEEFESLGNTHESFGISRNVDQVLPSRPLDKPGTIISVRKESKNSSEVVETKVHGGFGHGHTSQHAPTQIVHQSSGLSSGPEKIEHKKQVEDFMQAQFGSQKNLERLEKMRTSPYFNEGAFERNIYSTGTMRKSFDAEHDLETERKILQNRDHNLNQHNKGTIMYVYGQGSSSKNAEMEKQEIEMRKKLEDMMTELKAELEQGRPSDTKLGKLTNIHSNNEQRELHNQKHYIANGGNTGTHFSTEDSILQRGEFQKNSDPDCTYGQEIDKMFDLQNRRGLYTDSKEKEFFDPPKATRTTLHTVSTKETKETYVPIHAEYRQHGMGIRQQRHVSIHKEIDRKAKDENKNGEHEFVNSSEELQNENNTFSHQKGELKLPRANEPTLQQIDDYTGSQQREMFHEQSEGNQQGIKIENYNPQGNDSEQSDSKADLDPALPVGEILKEEVDSLEKVSDSTKLSSTKRAKRNAIRNTYPIEDYYNHNHYYNRQEHGRPVRHNQHSSGSEYDNRHHQHVHHNHHYHRHSQIGQDELYQLNIDQGLNHHGRHHHRHRHNGYHGHNHGHRHLDSQNQWQHNDDNTNQNKFYIGDSQQSVVPVFGSQTQQPREYNTGVGQQTYGDVGQQTEDISFDTHNQQIDDLGQQNTEIVYGGHSQQEEQPQKYFTDQGQQTEDIFGQNQDTENIFGTQDQDHSPNPITDIGQETEIAFSGNNQQHEQIPGHITDLGQQTEGDFGQNQDNESFFGAQNQQGQQKPNPITNIGQETEIAFSGNNQQHEQSQDTENIFGTQNQDQDHRPNPIIDIGQETEIAFSGNNQQHEQIPGHITDLGQQTEDDFGQKQDTESFFGAQNQQGQQKPNPITNIGQETKTEFNNNNQQHGQSQDTEKIFGALNQQLGQKPKLITDIGQQTEISFSSNNQQHGQKPGRITDLGQQTDDDFGQNQDTENFFEVHTQPEGNNQNPITNIGQETEISFSSNNQQHGQRPGHITDIGQQTEDDFGQNQDTENFFGVQNQQEKQIPNTETDIGQETEIVFGSNNQQHEQNITDLGQKTEDDFGQNQETESFFGTQNQDQDHRLVPISNIGQITEIAFSGNNQQHEQKPGRITGLGQETEDEFGQNQDTENFFGAQHQQEEEKMNPITDIGQKTEIEFNSNIQQHGESQDTENIFGAQNQHLEQNQKHITDIGQETEIAYSSNNQQHEPGHITDLGQQTEDDFGQTQETENLFGALNQQEEQTPNLTTNIGQETEIAFSSNNQQHEQKPGRITYHGQQTEDDFGQSQHTENVFGVQNQQEGHYQNPITDIGQETEISFSGNNQQHEQKPGHMTDHGQQIEDDFEQSQYTGAVGFNENHTVEQKPNRFIDQQIEHEVEQQNHHHNPHRFNYQRTYIPEKPIHSLNSQPAGDSVQVDNKSQQKYNNILQVVTSYAADLIPSQTNEHHSKEKASSEEKSSEESKGHVSDTISSHSKPNSKESEVVDSSESNLKGSYVGKPADSEGSTTPASEPSEENSTSANVEETGSIWSSFGNKLKNTYSSAKDKIKTVSAKVTDTVKQTISDFSE